MSIVQAIERTYKWIEDNGAAKTYWAVDIHGTVLKPDYQNHGISTEFYPYAKAVLRLLSESKEDVLIIFSSSRTDRLKEYGDFFRAEGIDFKYYNHNPEVKNKPNSFGSFTDKFYFNVMLEDKAGFDPDNDWEAILDYLRNHNG